MAVNTLSPLVDIINYTPCNMQQNSANIILIYNGASVINLPQLSTQNIEIQFVNLTSSTVITINSSPLDGGSTIYIMPINSFVDIFPNSSGSTWLILSLGQTGGLGSAWFTNGNSLASTGVIGSITNQNVDLVRNTITMLSLLAGAVTLQTNFNCNNMPLINCPNPINTQDVANRGYIDNKYTNLIGSVVNSVAIGNQTITLTQGINSTYCVLFNVYGTNFTQWYSQNCIVRPISAPDGYNFFLGYCSASTAAATAAALIIKAPTSIGGTSFTFNVALGSLTTGYDIYIYN